MSADLVSGQPWLGDLASRLVSRIDIDWKGLARIKPMVQTIDGKDEM